VYAFAEGDYDLAWADAARKFRTRGWIALAIDAFDD
jgi:hypothetical protein